MDLLLILQPLVLGGTLIPGLGTLDRIGQVSRFSRLGSCPNPDLFSACKISPLSGYPHQFTISVSK